MEKIYKFKTKDKLFVSDSLFIYSLKSIDRNQSLHVVVG